MLFWLLNGLSNQRLEISREIGAHAEILANYKQVVTAYSSMNKFDSASVYINLFATLKDSLSIESKQIFEPVKVDFEISPKQLERLKFYRMTLVIATIIVHI